MVSANKRNIANLNSIWLLVYGFSSFKTVISIFVRFTYSVGLYMRVHQ